jgi:hypothetical protein
MSYEEYILAPMPLDKFVKALRDEAGEQRAYIDGGDECRGKDAQLSELADMLDHAATRLERLAKD